MPKAVRPVTPEEIAAWYKEAYQRKRPLGGRVPKAHCKRKHPLSGDNLYWFHYGGYLRRTCRACDKQEAHARYHARKKEKRNAA